MKTEGMWCIHYSKVNEPNIWKVMKVQRTDGVLVAAKKRDEAYRFMNIHDAFTFAKELIDGGKYIAEVKKVSGFYFPE
jgi:hypothetical protein